MNPPGLIPTTVWLTNKVLRQTILTHNDSVCELAKAVHPQSHKYKRILVLIGYVDESGDSVDPECRFVSLAGLVANAEDWDVFKKKWKDALDEFTGGQPFHMKDFAHSRKLYAGWLEAKRKAFMANLVEAILSANVKPTGCAVLLSHYKALPPNYQEAFGDPYYMAFQEVTKGLALAAVPREFACGNESVAMVYAYQENFGATDNGRAQQLWHRIQADCQWGHWMGSYTSARTADSFPLQAADLFAYELTKEFVNWVTRPNDKMRWPLRQIIKSDPGPILITLYTMSLMLQTLHESGVWSVKPEKEFEMMLKSYSRIKTVREILSARAAQ